MNGRIFFIIGMKHTGKTTVGKALAEEMDLPFYDLDDIIRELDTKKTGGTRSVREIFRAKGPEGFRKLEGKAAKVLSGKIHSGIAALGGGTVSNPKAMKHLENRGTFVFLTEEPSLIYKRIEASGIPPFLLNLPVGPREAFMQLYSRRDEAYRHYADIVFPLEGRTPEEAVKALLAENQL